MKIVLILLFFASCATKPAVPIQKLSALDLIILEKCGPILDKDQHLTCVIYHAVQECTLNPKIDEFCPKLLENQI